MPLLTIAQPYVPADNGQVVNGFQDDFDGTSLKPGWAPTGANVFTVNNGLLHVASASGDPNHLTYQAPGYDTNVQEVLMRVRVTSFGSADPPRCGAALVVDSTPAGIVYLFRNNTGIAMAFLDDKRGWGSDQSYAWQNNVWYWLRVRHEPNAAANGGLNDAFAKIWPADGSTPEPAGWQATFDYTPTRTARTGFAGIAASSNGGVAEMDVDYILIKAAGLPSIMVSSTAFPATQSPAAITTQPQSQTVVEMTPAQLSVTATGYPPPTYQWYFYDYPMSGQTNSTLTLPDMSLDDSGALIKVVVANMASNVSYRVTSIVAAITVIPDVTPPTILRAQAIVPTQVQVFFSERMTEATATNINNYRLVRQGGSSVSILSGALSPDGTSVFLTVYPMMDGTTHQLMVSEVTDRASTPNVIASETLVSFVTTPYASADIGAPGLAGGASAVYGGYNISGGGSDIAGTADQFQFYAQAVTGDFDLQARVDSITGGDLWSKAGLMARETLSTNSRFAGTMATPGNMGSFFESRAATNVAASSVGYYPVNYPQTWLRLKRAGNAFTGFASWDGLHWTTLGTANLTLPSTLYFGLAVSGHDPVQKAIAAFRNISVAATPLAASQPSTTEPLGQAGRRTGLVISEIMYNPYTVSTLDLEYLELYNSTGVSEDLSGFSLTGDIDYLFPAGTTIPAGGFLVVARTPADVQSYYGIANIAGPYTNSLPNGGGTIRLRNPAGGIFIEVVYGTRPPWPAAADGTGHSLVLAHPSQGQNNPAAWAISDSVDGSPGRAEPVTLDPLRNVVINEFFAHSVYPLLDYVELYNHGNDPIDVSGCYLSDSRVAQPGGVAHEFRIPAGTILPARGFLVYNQVQMGLGLNSAGESILFWNAAHTRVLDCVHFDAQESGVSMGRVPDGAKDYYPLQSRTPGAPNGPLRVNDIIINELMFDPISGDNADEYVELYNKGTNVVNIGGWGLVDGIDYVFPSNTMIFPGAYLVVASDSAHLKTLYPQLNQTNLIGNYTGALANSGERVALAKFELVVTTNLLAAPLVASLVGGGNPQDFVVPTNSVGTATTNRIYSVIDEVTYFNGGRWGVWSGGGGSSLELADSRSNKRLGANWADSDESAKAPWTYLNYTATVDNGTTATADQLQVLLQGAGECLIDDVQVINSLGVNVITNSSFETGVDGWFAEGTESTSSWETGEGYNSARSYHVRAVKRGDNQINRIRVNLSAALTSGTTATIRARVRWLKGSPGINFRIRGCWLEFVGTMTLPPDLGTPGLPNTRRVTNTPPAIYEVSHFPTIPASGQPVVVTARASDPDGVTSMSLYYRVDPGTNFVIVPMLDDGTGGDAVAGDGLYSATLPAPADNMLVAFHVRATDGFAPPATSRFPSDAPTRECLVRFGETTPAGNMPVYRMWITQSTFNKWSSRHKLDNSSMDITFVTGQRAIYNAESLFSGSPYIGPGFTTPSGNRCGYTVTFPPDDLFLGGEDLSIDWPGGHGNENTAVQEEMAYWIASKIGLEFSHRYYIRLQVNGVTDMQRGGIFEAILSPADEYIQQWMPKKANGEFYKIDRSFELNDAGALMADPPPLLANIATTGGAKKASRYRWTWMKRGGGDQANYTNIFNLVDAANTTDTNAFTAQLDSLANMDQWMRVFAFEHIINNFDSYGHDIGKNMYAYKPDNGKWRLFAYDLDWLMLVSPNGPGAYTASTGPLFSTLPGASGTPGLDPVVLRMCNHPPFRRAYYRAALDAANGPLMNSLADPVMDAKYKYLVANGVTMCDGAALVSPTLVKTWFSDRRTYILNQLAMVNSTFAVATPTNNFSATNNLLVLSGVAPITVKTIAINGKEVPVTWTSVSNWTYRLPLMNSTNELSVAGYDTQNALVSGASNNLTVLFTNGVVPPPQGLVVLCEVMFNPTNAGGAYVELFNASTNTSYDLSGWRINGISYSFPSGSYIAPRSYLVLAQDRFVLAAAYGTTNVVVFDEFSGTLKTNGETLTLFQPAAPGAADTNDVVVSRVRYEARAPWPSLANGQGAALQLVDSTRNVGRVANWSDGSGWRFVSFTATNGAASKLIRLYPDAAGDVYIDDLKLVAGRVPEEGSNLILDGDFEGPFTTNQNGPWAFVGTYGTNSAISTNIAHSGKSSLHMIYTPGSSMSTAPILQTQQTNFALASTVYTVSFWYLPGTNISAITTYIGSNFRPTFSVKPPPFSPGAPNTTAALLPPMPPVYLNEVQAENMTGPTDSNGQREPWVELYNSAATNIDLSGWHLTDTYTNLTRWAFPSNTIIQAGQYLKVWADGEPQQTVDTTNLHTSFRLVPTNGSVALVMPFGGTPQVYDYLNYDDLPADYSYGAFPDGQLFYRQPMFYTTPGAPNIGSNAPVVIYINEWIADNINTIANPANNVFEDWFELYNPGSKAVDLGGFYLTDTLLNRTQYKIPSGWKVPAHGYLMVWANNLANLNDLAARPDLNVNFHLSKSGDAIVLLSPDGAIVDEVAFGLQVTDVSSGRFPDGSANIQVLSHPTPGAPNDAIANTNNTAPIFGLLPQRTVFIGQTLSFTVTATDNDQPAQSLTFNLEPGYPVGASLNPGTGLFTWTPTTAQAPMTNTFIVTVTDNGVPPLSATNSFVVWVEQPPRFAPGQTVVNGSQMTIQFGTIPGQSYRVDYKVHLDDPSWIPVGLKQTATGASLTVTDDMAGHPQRFYRIVVAP